MSKWRKHRGALALVATLLAPERALAGNDDGILIGSEAMLSAGAVTATVSDGSGAWYNPAGLAQLRRQSFDVNASTYGISRTTARGFFTLGDGTQTSASVVDWQLVPSALSYARRLSEKLVGAFGIFVPTTTDGDLRASLNAADGTRWTVGLDQYRTEYAYVLSLAGRVSDRLRWGVALHGVFISAEQMVQIGAGTPGAPAEPLVLVSGHRSTDDYGLRVGCGLQWTPWPALSLGVAVQTPTLTGFRTVNDAQLSGAFSTGSGGTFTSQRRDATDAVWELSTPLLMRFGVAYAIDRFRILLDATVTSALSSAEDELDRRWSGNARVGGLFVASEKLTFGAGVFSDLDAERDARTDFVGVAGGVRVATNLRLDSGRPLAFVTSVGLRYAAGFGETAAIDLLSDDARFGLLASSSARVRVHEVAINVGGGVTY